MARRAARDFGTALKFDGADDVVVVTHASPINLGALASSHTVAFWFKSIQDPAATTKGWIVGKRSSGAGAYPFAFYVSPTKQLTFSKSDGSNEPTTSYDGFVDNSWHFVMYSRNAAAPTATKIYIDGQFELVDIDDTTTATSANTDNLHFGAETTTTNEFNGFLDEVRIWNTALTYSEYLTLYSTRIVPQQASLVGEWKFNEGSGATATDSSASANNGAITGATYTTDVPATARQSASRSAAGTRFLAKEFGTALSFDGVNDKIAVASIAAQNDLTSVSLSAWVYVKGTGGGGQGRVFEKGVAVRNLRMLGGPNRFIWSVGHAGTTGDWTITNSYNRKWTHIVVTHANLDLTTTDPIFYINGALVSSGELTTPVGAVSADSTDITIGGRQAATDRTFDGILDEVQWYNRVLTPTEVSQLYYGHVESQSGCVGNWKFNEGSGTTAIDSSSSGTNGSISGATYSTDVFSKGRQST